MTYPIGRWKAERGGKRFVVSEPEPSRVVVVVPLKAGVRDRVRELLEMGPPFDPEAAGLDRRYFSPIRRLSSCSRHRIRPPSIASRASPKLRWAAVGWREYLGGRTRLAKIAYSWARDRRSEGADPRG